MPPPDPAAVDAAMKRVRTCIQKNDAFLYDMGPEWKQGNEDMRTLADACEHYRAELAAVTERAEELRVERDMLLDSTNRDRTLTRPAGDYPEFMLQAFLDSGIAGTGAAKQAGALLRERTAALAAATARAERLEERYNELLLHVGNKYEGETRHQTALRYIRQAEERCEAALSAKEGNADGK